jgi:hypothetical protein
LTSEPWVWIEATIPTESFRSPVVSDRVHRDHRGGRRYQANRAREEWMKQCILDEVALATERDGRPPKVVLKFGHMQLFRGISPLGIQTLGNFVSEYARVRGDESFHVALFPNNPSGGYGDLRRYRDPASASARPRPAFCDVALAWLSTPNAR